MKRIAIAVSFAAAVLSTAFPMSAQNTISISGGFNLNGGHEVALESENFFKSNHKYSLYGLFDYHFAKETWFGQSVDCKKAMAEIGAKKYFQVIEDKLYPYLGLGMTAGVQNLHQNTNKEESVIDEQQDPFPMGGVGTIGIEYMLSDRIALRFSGRFKYDGHMHYILGGGLTFAL